MSTSSKTYLADILKSELELTHSSNYIITTPPGSGKTFAIRELLFPRVYTERSALLYVVNRIALAKQIQRMLDEYAQQHPEQAEYLLSHVHVVTYQKIETLLSSNTALNYPYNPTFYYGGYICLDEFHYVWHDSLFNTQTMLSYTFFTQATAATRFFMSASLTPDMIKTLEKTLSDNCPLGSYTALCRSHNSAIFTSRIYKEINQMEPNYSYLNLEAFSTIEELPELLKNVSGKTLIFVSSIREGNLLLSLIEDSLPERNCDFLCSDYRSNPEMADTMETIVSTDRFDSDILITTTVIDNGINLTDKSIKNIVVLTHNKISLEQCLSRRRVEAGEKITLYLCRRSLKYFTDIKQHLDRIWNCYVIMARLNPAFRLQRYCNDRVNAQFYDKIGHYSASPYGQSFEINPLSIQYLSYELTMINEIIEQFRSKGKNAFLDIQRGWLSSDAPLPYSDHTIASIQEQFRSLLRDISGEKMSSQELSSWLKNDNVKRCIVHLSPDKLYASKPVTKAHLINLLASSDFGFEIAEKTEHAKKFYTINQK